ncbi:MAG: ankyrin repeat domain-containing protein [Chloroflexi bacterium]|nr:ankyrin repeat domain-containing protein [Chloroflexota bacterium]
MTLSAETIREFVIAGHSDLEKVQTMLTAHPHLLHAAHYWAENDPETALDAGAHMGNRAIVEYLLTQGAPLTFYAACMLGMSDTVHEYLDMAPNLASRPGVHGISALFHAAMSGDIAIGNLLAGAGGVENKALVSHALHGAVAFNQRFMVEWLIGHHPDDINMPNFEKKTPLRVAVERGYSDVADLLRANGGSE